MSDRISPPRHPGLHVKESIIPDDLSVTEASKLLGIGRPALSNFLNGKAGLSQNMATRLAKTFGASKKELLALQRDFDAFLAQDQEKQIVVRSHAKNFLSIRARDLEAWAENNIDARAHLAAFLRRLAYSTGSHIKKIDFPAYDNSQRHGWDGYIDTDNATPWVPEGVSGWEFGCSRDPLEKANRDYHARTLGPTKVAKKDRETTTFVFATPRNWSGKEKWASTKRAENKWKDVRAYDANDLEQWLEQSASAQVWMAGEMGVPREGCQTLDERWDSWAGATAPPMSPKIFDSSITNHEQKLYEWLAGERSPRLVVCAGSKEEAIAFLAAAALKIESLRPLTDQAVIVSSGSAINKLTATSTSFIPVTIDSEAEIELARTSSEKQAIIIVERNFIGIEPDIVVDLPNYESFRDGLEDMGLNTDDIERYSNLTGKSPTILRRHLTTLPALKTPGWAADTNRIKAMIPFVLAGAWCTSQIDDREILKVLTNQEWDETEKVIGELASIDDAPIWAEGQYRGVVSKLDCLNAVAHQITANDLECLFFTAEMILSEDDPALDLEKDQRWAANIYDKVRDHSNAIRESICETVILLSVHGNGLFGNRLGIDAEVRANMLVKNLLKDQESRVWQSQQDKLPRYAEAAPDTFLDIIEEELSKEVPGFAVLFEPVDGSFLTSRCERTGMLWALELLAWYPDRLARVSRILARLCFYELDDNWSNKPINSLIDILLSWRPHTSASLSQRCDVLALLCRDFPDVGWNICMRHLKPGTSSTSGTYRPRLRGDASGAGQNSTVKDHYEFLDKCRELALAWDMHNARTLSDLIECLAGMNEGDTEIVKSLVKSWRASNPPEEDIIALRERVRTTTLTYRAQIRRKGDVTGYANGKEIYDLLEPDDVVFKNQWLFAKDWVEFSPEELIEDEFDHDEREKRLTAQKIEALEAILAEAGEEGIFRLCLGGEGGFNIGFLLGSQVMGPERLLEFAHTCATNERYKESPEVDRCLSGVLRQLDEDDVPAFLHLLLDRVPEGEQTNDQRLKILTCAPFAKPVWKLVEQLGGSISSSYWQKVYPGWAKFSDDALNYLVRNLLAVDRPRAAFHIAHLDPDKVDETLLVELLNKLGTSTTEPDGHYNPTGYYIESALESLNNRSVVEASDLVRLEFLYIDALTPTSEYGFPNLSKELADSPMLFMQMVAACFRRDDDGIDPPEWKMPDNAEQARSFAKSAFNALEYACGIPGETGDEIDISLLRSWISEVRALAREHGRVAITDQRIGHILSFTSAGADGIWPREEIRVVFEEFASREISIGMEIGLYNRGGAHFREKDSQREKDLATTYTGYADALMNEFPFTARMLRSIARNYSRDAEWWEEDERVSRRLRR